MAVSDLKEGVSEKKSAMDSALVLGLGHGKKDSKASIREEPEDDSESSCSASTETVATNLETSDGSAQSEQVEIVVRRVRFANKTRVRKIPHHNDLSEEQIEQIWISKEDYRALRQDCAKRIRFLDKVKMKEPNEAPFCVRGLLNHTASARAKKNAYRDVMYDALAQALDKELEENIEEALAQICKICSAPSVKTAHLEGLADEKEAMRIHGI